MLKRNWTEKPVTWGGYLKLCGIMTVISLIYSGIYMVAVFWPNWWEDTKDWFKRHFGPKRKEEEI